MLTVEGKIEGIGEWLGTGSLNFFGRQFAGKDTQAELLGRYLGAPVISGGGILRSDDIPEEVRIAINSGDLSPTDQYKQIVLPYLGRDEYRGVPLMLSSIGRMSGEEIDVVEAASLYDHPIKAVPYLEITEEESFRRLESSPSRGRADDNNEGLNKRLKEFDRMTMPVLDYYEQHDLLVRVDAMPEERFVFDALVHHLYEYAQTHD